MLLHLWVPLLAAAIGASYWVGLSGPYFSDDFQFYFASGFSKPLRFFYERNPDNEFYRPLQASFMAAVQAIWGLNPVPIHVTTMLLHTLLSILVFVAMKRIGFKPLQAILASGYMALSQANVLAVVSVDTLSQVSSTLFACLALGWIYVATLYGGLADGDHGGVRRGPYLAGFLCFGLSLLGKETGVSVILPIGLLMVAGNRASRSLSRALLRSIAQVLPFVVVLIAYLWTRSSVTSISAAIGARQYEFHLGTNIVVNAGLLLFAAFVPASSVMFFTALDRGDLARVALIAMATLIVVVGCLWGLGRSGRKPILGFLGTFALIAFFPAAALNHVSELYVYNALPFLSMLLGAGLGGLLEGRRGLRAKAGSLLVGVLFLSHVVAVQQKGTLMTRNGRRAMELISEIQPWLEKVPPRGNLALVNPPSARQGQYSAFLINGFNVLNEGAGGLARALGREDIRIRVIDSGPGRSTLKEGLALTLENGRVVPYSQALNSPVKPSKKVTLGAFIAPFGK